VSKGKRRALLVVAVLLLGLGVATDRLFIHPRLAPVPPAVDAIIELGGAGMAGRDSLALELARSGHAPYLVQSTLADAQGTSSCLPAVPDVTVLCFHAEPNTTRGEARWIADEAKRRHWRSVVLVTTPDQAWRARLRTTRCFDGDVYVATSPLPWTDWPRQVPYQWAATAKAVTLERSC
jgi:uncharacterized SAM-binding protein YcdF (DUF218 family)